MGFLKKVTGSYPATQNRISQQRLSQQQGVAHPIHATAVPSPATPTSPVTATAYVTGQPVVSPAPVVVTTTAFVPGQQRTEEVYATAPTVDSLPPPVAPPPSYNPTVTSTANNIHSNRKESKFWECTACTFPNLRTEQRCKGCGLPIPPGMYRPAQPATVASSTYPPSPATMAPVTQHTTVPTNQLLVQQMNHMHLSTNNNANPPSSRGTTMRVPVPHGMQPGQKIKVRSPDGNEVIQVIPPRKDWLTDEHGQSFFRMTFTVVVAGATILRQTTNTTSSCPPPPYATTWRSFHPQATSAYSPPPIGMRSVPHTPGNSTPIPPNGRHKSLLIGINYTGTRAALKGCINDAKNMQQLLLQNGFPNDGSHMLLLTDDRSRGNEYQPSASNILKAFKWFLSDVQKGDVLFFHFSGHGGQVPDKTGMEADGYNETLVPLDYQRAGQISDDVLWGSLVYPLPEGVRLTALMDMCHSGTGLDLPYDYNVDSRRWREDANPAHSKGDVVLFSGCEDAQTSADVQSGWQAGGAMTMAFTKAYQQCQMATYHEFLMVVKRELRRKGMRQRPQLTSSQKFDANSRIFSFGHMRGGRGGVPTTIESNHNPMIGRKKNRHIRPARPGFGGGGGNDLFAMAAAGAGAMLFANALGNMFD